MRGRLLLLVTVVTILCAPAFLRAQAVGEITGTVTDPTGAVMTNAKITAVQTGTGLTRSTVSSCGSPIMHLGSSPAGSVS